MLGLYFWIAYSLYRVLILYSIFNFVFLYLTKISNVESKGSWRRFSSRVGLWRVTIFILSLMFAIIIVTVCRSSFMRPNETLPITILTIILFVSILLSGHVFHVKASRFDRLFLTFALMFIVVFMRFSIYFVQPNIYNAPLYATVDAYRDYANAFRILTFSHFSNEKMVLEKYYKAFPVLPLELVSTHLVSGLPLSFTVIFFGIVFEIVNVILLILLTRLIIRGMSRFDNDYFFIVLLVVLLLSLYPLFLEPMFILSPLRFSLLFTAILVYNCIKQIFRSFSLSSSILRIFTIALIIPLHASSSFFALILLLILALYSMDKRNRGPYSVIGNPFLNPLILHITCFAFYLVFATLPLLSVIQVISSVTKVLDELLKFGVPYTAEIVENVWLVKSNEFDNFVNMLPTAFLLSVITVFLIKSVLDEKVYDKKTLLFTYLSLLPLFFYILGHFTALWRIDARYFIFPFHILSVFSVTAILKYIFVRNFGSLRGYFMAFVVIALYVLSTIMSPSFLHERSPAYARLIPMDSETTAVEYVFSGLSVHPHNNLQIVTDWPFHAYVRSILYTKYMNLEENLKIPTLMYEQALKMDSIIICRQYFYQSKTLQKVSPYVSILNEVESKTLLDRIFNSGSTFVTFIEYDNET